MNKTTLLVEDFLDDFDPQKIRNKNTVYTWNPHVSKNLLGRSKKSAASFVKEFNKKEMFEYDFAKQIRNGFTSAVKFKDSTYYRDVTIMMRQVGDIQFSTEDDFISKDKVRIASNTDDPFTDIDGIALSELCVIYAYGKFFTKEEWMDLSDDEKYEICKWCAFYIKNRYKDHLDTDNNFEVSFEDEFHPSHYNDKPIHDIFYDRDEFHLADLFNCIVNPDFDIDCELAKNYTKDEINQDAELRKAAKTKHNDRSEVHQQDRQKIKQTIDNKISRYRNKVFERYGWKEIYDDIINWWGAYIYAMAGWDYLNVDHVAEEAVANKLEYEGIEKYGKEEWDKAYKEVKDFCGGDLNVPKDDSTYRKASNDVKDAVEKFGYFKHS